MSLDRSTLTLRFRSAVSRLPSRVRGQSISTTSPRVAPARIAALVVLMAGVLIAGAAGLRSYTTVAAESHSGASKYAVGATLIEEPEQVASYRYQAKTQWHRAGRDETATVTVPRTATRGDRLTVWLDADDAPTSAPRTITHAVMAAIGAAVVALVSAGIAAWALIRIFDHRRPIKRFGALTC
ncbi:hypothetical protein ACFYV7_30640 [Nocardia suismassiliense]|uniref:DUF3592 domain-containing protein n=1 Tax=Nocardia suismassiliense TaxID=2077092 RepID=A0ABW6R0Y5_9NOCA